MLQAPLITLHNPLPTLQALLPTVQVPKAMVLAPIAMHPALPVMARDPRAHASGSYFQDPGSSTRSPNLTPPSPVIESSGPTRPTGTTSLDSEPRTKRPPEKIPDIQEVSSYPDPAPRPRKIAEYLDYGGRDKVTVYLIPPRPGNSQEIIAVVSAGAVCADGARFVYSDDLKERKPGKIRAGFPKRSKAKSSIRMRGVDLERPQHHLPERLRRNRQLRVPRNRRRRNHLPSHRLLPARKTLLRFRDHPDLPQPLKPDGVRSGCFLHWAVTLNIADK